MVQLCNYLIYSKYGFKQNIFRKYFLFNYMFICLYVYIWDNIPLLYKSNQNT